ncbi:MAG: hypothetical protein VB111_02030 [Clostridiaceae bacterium]|nr:hypothetical protein [Clostridiaceae bacterium]
MRICKRICAFALILAMIAALTACGGGNSATTNTASTTAAGSGEPSGGTPTTAAATTQPSLAFQATYASLPEGLDYVNNPVLFDGRIWTLSGVYDEESQIYQSAVFSFLPDGSDVQKILLPIAQNRSYQNLVVTDDGEFWISMQEYPMKGEAVDYESGNVTYALVRYDAEGQEQAKIDLSFIGEDQEQVYINNLACDSEGNLILCADQKIYVLDPTGARLFDLSCNWVESLARTGEGKVILGYHNDQGSYAVAEIDMAAKSFGKSYAVTGNMRGIASGDGTYLFYAVNNDYLCGYNAATESLDQLFKFLDIDINSDQLNGVMNVGERTFLTFVNSDMGSELCTIKEAPYAGAKTTLTLACLYADYTLKEQVIRFNKSSPDYRIDILDYSQYNTESDYEAGLTKLSTDITAGQIPDLLELSQLPVATYAAKGILADLDPFLDTDPDLHRDDLLESALSALTINGKLYSLATTMTVMSMYSLKDIAGDRTSITMKELADIIAAHPEAASFANMTSANVLQFLCMFTFDDYVDSETGECRFDSDEFRALLEIANKSPAEIDYENYEYVDGATLMTEGKALFDTMYLSDLTELQRMMTSFKGQLAITGFPVSSGSGNVAQFNFSLGISAKSAHTDGAWTFLRSLFLVDAEDANYSNLGYGIPVLKTLYEKMITEASTPEYYEDENGKQIEQPKMSMSYNNGPTIEIFAATEEEVALFRSIVDSVDRTYTYDTKLMNILIEETGAYFAGQKSAADVASIIQSRVQIYIAETR